MKKLIVPSLMLFLLLGTLAMAEGPYMANGIKIGEVDQTTAIIWTRLTSVKKGNTAILNAAPGYPGEVRIVYQSKDSQNTSIAMPWRTVTKKTDFATQFELKGLQADTSYTVSVEARAVGSTAPNCTRIGSFKTAPAVDSEKRVRFAVVTCQSIRSIDAGENGFITYRILDDIRPDFFVHTGDILYYDLPPLLAKNEKDARCKWNCMYSYGHLVKFHLNTPSFFMKDDHDTLKNDCWAGQTYGDLTWNQGLRIFREQNPLGEQSFRTRRWGKDVQFWLTENRDFRSPNNMTDGPEKTIYGPRQKKWLKETMADSDAAFRFLISPGCIIGPDKRGKSDNHANKVFQNEGDEMRQFLAPMRDNTFIICGDRHWQYHSLHPELKINEFGCGPIGDKHTYGGNCGRQPALHQYFDRGGGFLLVTVERKKGVPQATFQYYAARDKDPNTDQWTIRYEKTFTARTTDK